MFLTSHSLNHNYNFGTSFTNTKKQNKKIKNIFSLKRNISKDIIAIITIIISNIMLWGW